MFAGAVKQVLKAPERKNFTPNSMCVIRVSNASQDIKQVAGIECNLEIDFALDSVSIAGQTLLGTIDPIFGPQLVSTPIPQPMVDWKKVSGWVKDCHSVGHQSCRQAKPDALHTSKLPVIDVKRMCITSIPATSQYATLSYVWGTSSTQLQATTENEHDLAMEGSLNINILPRTIDDAIVACGNMNIDYLWVDRLCILQDERPDKKAYWLDAMGAIYARSLVTLVALSGNDAEHGLPGVNMVKREAFWVGISQGISLIEPIPKFDRLLRDSRWNSRGWTYQEAMLSARRLFFSTTTAFYQCCDPKTPYDEIYGACGTGNQKDEDLLSSYGHTVERFTQRNLTWESDILGAFAGILRSEWGPHCYYGLPLSIFRDAILWTSLDQAFVARHPVSGDYFPTWSWSSIKDSIQVKSARKQADWNKVRASLANWAIPSMSGRRQAFRVVSNTLGEPSGLDELAEWRLIKKTPQESFRVTSDSQSRNLFLERQMPLIRSQWYLFPRLAVMLAWKYGCFSGPLPDKLNTNATWEEYEELMFSKWKSLAQLCDEAHGMPRGVMSEADMEAKFPREMRQGCPPGSILVYTQSLDLSSLALNFKRRKSQGEDELQIEVNGFVAWMIPGSINTQQINVRQQNPNVSFNLLALSVIPSDPKWPDSFGGNEEHWWSDSAGVVLEDKSFIQFRPEPFQVELMVVETENGLSRRVALAWASLKPWIKQKPRARAFRLV
ncbi:hypothetical protein N7486_004056 [Penicillium sp. IBT 16267x]|nr:hypothetical protein N7486_004056 [Penicillium sp. IBT 16267x]